MRTKRNKGEEKVKMSSALSDRLAKKEEELRQLNEKLEKKNRALLEEAEEEEDVEHQHDEYADPDYLDQEEEKEVRNHEEEYELNNTGRYKDDDHIDAYREEEQYDHGEDREEQHIGATEDDQDGHQENNFESQDADYFVSDVKNTSVYQKLYSENKENEATIAFQRARIEALQTELENSISNLNAQELELNEFRSKGKSLSEDSKKYGAQISTLNSNLEKMKKQNADLNDKLQRTERELILLRSEAEGARRDLKKNEQGQKGKDAKLNRLIEEVEKYKSIIKEHRTHDTEKNDIARHEMDRLAQENKKLEKQKTELLQAFKKQLKLIDILKRQKIHIEASKMLQFTEEEFVKVLDLGEKL
eukprot:CAMPEP_0115012318 /NCGR_PEP_ID=MMETSP0216-20121206/24650_1 /TAXON_ID=223996 /ORGANISM="Protocruzia adherens, Strain Boccale" /LENGTH=360 /DNA_ID=CAMNT_0002381321 /DNA_START=1 /DNA_END=1083 /DNA_ORIENTATION=-